MVRILLSLIIALPLFGYSCQWTKPYFRKYSNQIFGIQYPYQLFVAQAWAESKCRPSAISNDGIGSQGIGQITWRWWKHYLKPRGVPNLNTIDRQVKAQVLVMARMYAQAYTKTKCTAHWIPFQAYNGGWLVAKEIRRAGSCSWRRARLYCNRREIYFSNGSHRNACDINYNYSKHIYRYATHYYGYYDKGDFWK